MRDLVKTLTYGGMHFVVAVAVAFAISGSWQVALGIGLVEPLVQTLCYLLHERAWQRLGRRRPAGRPEGRAARCPERRAAPGPLPGGAALQSALS